MHLFNWGLHLSESEEVLCKCNLGASLVHVVLLRVELNILPVEGKHWHKLLHLLLSICLVHRSVLWQIEVDGKDIAGYRFDIVVILDLDVPSLVVSKVEVR